MRCLGCGKEMLFVSGGTLSFEDESIGNFSVSGIDFHKCGCGETILKNESIDLIEAEEDRILKNLIGQLPISEFVNATSAADLMGISRQRIHQHRKIKNGFVYSIKLGKHTMYHKGSIERFVENGDGRFPLINDTKPEKEYVLVVGGVDGEATYERTQEETVLQGAYHHWSWSSVNSIGATQQEQ